MILRIILRLLLLMQNMQVKSKAKELEDTLKVQVSDSRQEAVKQQEIKRLKQELAACTYKAIMTEYKITKIKGSLLW